MKLFLSTLALLLGLFLMSYGDMAEITDYRGESIQWTTSTTNTICVLTVEWSPDSTSTVWRSDWNGLSEIVTTDKTASVRVPMFYRVRGYSYSEESDTNVLRQMYIDAVRDASNAMPNEISQDLVAISEHNTNIAWRISSNGVKQVKVVSFMTASIANSYYSGETNVTYGEQWVTVYPELLNFCRNYQGTNQILRIKQVLGMPYWSANDTIVEFWVDPNFLFRPAPDPEIYDHEATLNMYSNSLLFMATMALSSNYVNWYTNTFYTRHYDIPGGDPSDSWPWTRLGYTYDWGNPSNHVGLSEFVIPKHNLWPWPGGKQVAIEGVVITNASTYGK